MKIVKAVFEEENQALLEIILGIVIVYLNIHLNHNVTFIEVSIAACSFVIIKFLLNGTTKLFEISIRNFGKYMEVSNPPLSVAVTNQELSEK